MHDAHIPRRKAVQHPRRGQIYRQDRSVTPGAPPYWNPPYVQPQRFFSFGPCTARRRGEIHSTPSPPSARTPLRSFAPPLPTKSADFVGVPVAFWRNQKEKMGGKRRSAACGGCSKPLSRMRHDWRPRQGPGIVPPRRCCNEPASILAGTSPPVRASTTFPLRGKSKLLLSEKNPPFPCGENPHPPRGSAPMEVPCTS